MSVYDRREFINRSAILSAAAAAGAGLTADTARAAEAAAAKKGAANDRLRVAIVGLRGRGGAHVNGFLGKNNCEIVSVCDCDEAVIGGAMKKITSKQKQAPKYVKDVRELLDDKEIDVVSIATPNHWHATMAVWAMRAGKDVYCEKPLTHNVHEGRLIVEAAKKYGKILQTGTQSRSNPGMRDAIQYLHDGKAGPVELAYGTCYKPRGSIGKVDGPQEPPETMDYDLWCGPAPKNPPHRKTKNGTVHYDWHWIWDYGNGDFGNQGVHEADKARWGLGQSGMPSSVVSVGGRLGYEDDGETPNTQLCLYTYPDGRHVIFEVRGLKTEPYMGSKVGNIWFGSDGYVVCPSYAGGYAFDRAGKKVAEFRGGGDQHHFDNFVAAVRSRKSDELNAPAEEGHQSAALCHFANISYLLGKEAPIAKADGTYAGYGPAKDALDRMLAHLKDNNVDISEAMGRIGATLSIDPKTEKITGAGDADLAQANEMLFRDYRKGFDITEAV